MLILSKRAPSWIREAAEAWCKWKKSNQREQKWRPFWYWFWLFYPLISRVALTSQWLRAFPTPAYPAQQAKNKPSDTGNSVPYSLLQVCWFSNAPCWPQQLRCRRRGLRISFNRVNHKELSGRLWPTIALKTAGSHGTSQLRFSVFYRASIWSV